MKSLWNDQEAAQYTGDLGLRIYASRLLGRDTSLVLHGGGSVSIKIRERNIFGEDEDILHVGGGGSDIESITAESFSPCRMSQLLRLARLTALTDLRMANELKCSLTNAVAPMPPPEAILHAILPARFVDHTRPDALIAVMNTPGGEERVRELYGDRVVVIPYSMPWVKLTRLCAELYPRQAGPRTVGMALMNHGLFTFGDSVKLSYERMIELVTLAEEYLAKHGAWRLLPPEIALAAAPSVRIEVAELRRKISIAMGAPAILSIDADAACLDFARRPDVAVISQQGPAIPDHVIRTKRVPMLGRGIEAFRTVYEEYFNSCAAAKTPKPTMSEAAPRVILDPELGLAAIGRTAEEAVVAHDIYRHTIDIILRATALGGWQALPASDVFDIEYRELERTKLREEDGLKVYAGRVALVTGAASGIGKACVDSLLKRGAAVVGLDINAGITRLGTRPDCRGIICDVTKETDVTAAIEEAVRAFGGLDFLILNAGIFPKGAPIVDLDVKLWHRVMAVNLDANLFLLRECYPILKLAPMGGRVVVIGSKNVAAPGPGVAAYSASKAAMNQLARVAALEWGKDGIRINCIHPNLVFDTALWTAEVLQSRARHYGLTVEEYKANNILKVEITSSDVAEMAAEMCGPLFAKTTAAQVPVDGGNERII